MRATAVLIALAALAHAASLSFSGRPGATGFLVALLAASLLPYLLVYALLRWSKQIGPALGALAALVAIDATAYWETFIRPTSSTSALVLLFAPFWKLVLALPVGAALGWVIERLVRGR
jgi:hypothetical protein